MFTDGKRVLDKSVAPDVLNPIFYTTELDDNSNAVLVNLHRIIPEWQKSSRQSFPVCQSLMKGQYNNCKIGNNACSFIDVCST